MHGKEINLTAGNTTIKSTNFSVDKNGNITAKSGTIGGFTLGATEFTGNLSGKYEYNSYDLRASMCVCMDWLYKDSVLADLYDANEDKVVNSGDFVRIENILLGKQTNIKTVNGSMEINSTNPKNCIVIKKGNETAVTIGVGGVNSNLITTDNIVCGKINNNVLTGVTINGNTGVMTFIKHTGGGYSNGTTITPNDIRCQWLDVVNDSSCTSINPNGITTPSLSADWGSIVDFHQGSLEALKKNISKTDISAIDVIKNADIYSYNLKTEKDTDKKHIGFVIGKKYKTPNEVISKSGDGIDTYTMSSIEWKALQEIVSVIEVLQKRVQVLEEK